MLTNIKIVLGDIVLSFISEIPLKIGEYMSRFCVSNDIRADVTINVKFTGNTLKLPNMMCGDDLLMNYYCDEKWHYAVSKPGILGPVTIVKYTEDFSKVTVFVNELEHPGIVRTVDKVLQLFPIRMLLMKYNAMVLHASRICVNNKGILFTAPSGTGKSTQAMLWKKYENAEIVCNDRTLIRYCSKEYYTYGYPIDGSSPIAENLKLEMGAIIVLRQGSENIVERLNALKALKYLIEQTVFDTWNSYARNQVIKEWVDILNRYPIYLLTCKPDKEAVECLKQRMIEDEVI